MTLRKIIVWCLVGIAAYVILASGVIGKAYNAITNANQAATSEPQPLLPEPAPAGSEPAAAPAVNAVATSGEITAAQMNAFFTECAWDVFPDRRDGVAVNCDREWKIDYPIANVDHGIKYTFGMTVPSGGATAWLSGQLNATDWQAKLTEQQNRTENAILPETCNGPSTKAELSMPNVASIDVIDAANAQVKVTFKAAGEFTVPAGWTLDYNSGPKYISGKTVTIVATELTGTLWGPSCSKPLK